METIIDHQTSETIAHEAIAAYGIIRDSTQFHGIGGNTTYRTISHALIMAVVFLIPALKS